MIPYFAWTHVQLGPITLYVWGFFVGMGILIGAMGARFFARRHGLQEEVIMNMATWGAVWGILGARIGYILFYSPYYFFTHPLEMIKIWDGGMSMMGALIGAGGAMLWFLYHHKIPLLPYLDAFSFGLPAGYACGRIGCFLIHDHPGTATHFFLGIKYPDGIARHDLGLYLSLFGLCVAILFFLIRKKSIPHGVWFGMYFLLYGIIRFWLDFYRTQDVTYFGLTPAQYIAILLIIGSGTLLFTRNWKSKNTTK